MNRLCSRPVTAFSGRMQTSLLLLDVVSLAKRRIWRKWHGYVG